MTLTDWRGRSGCCTLVLHCFRFQPAASSSRSQIAVRTARAVVYLIWERLSVNVRQRPVINVAIVTQLVTRLASSGPRVGPRFQADTYQLIRAGLSGGKGVPETVAAHPCVFATLTAPSFGPVHVQREKDGRARRCRPRRRGQICPQGYRLSCLTDTPGTMLGSVSRCARSATTTPAPSCSTPAPELWRRFTITLRRTIARRAGLSSKQLAAQRPRSPTSIGRSARPQPTPLMSSNCLPPILPHDPSDRGTLSPSPSRSGRHTSSARSLPPLRVTGCSPSTAWPPTPVHGAANCCTSGGRPST